MREAPRYRDWLRGLTRNGAGPSYGMLFDMAWAVRFRWSVPNDDNRAADGLGLREMYERESSTVLPDLGECRFLEFLIGLAIRINNVLYDNEHPNQIPYWFWALINNLEIANIQSPMMVVSAFERVNNREYDYDGFGGLFPLKRPEEDQREIEIWYQMQYWLKENA